MLYALDRVNAPERAIYRFKHLRLRRHRRGAGQQVIDLQQKCLGALDKAAHGGRFIFERLEQH